MRHLIVSIAIEGQTAVAQLRIEGDEKKIHDFMTLQKLKDTWHKVNKSFIEK